VGGGTVHIESVDVEQQQVDSVGAGKVHTESVYVEKEPVDSVGGGEVDTESAHIEQQPTDSVGGGKVHIESVNVQQQPVDSVGDGKVDTEYVTDNHNVPVVNTMILSALTHLSIHWHFTWSIWLVNVFFRITRGTAFCTVSAFNIWHVSSRSVSRSSSSTSAWWGRQTHPLLIRPCNICAIAPISLLSLSSIPMDSTELRGFLSSSLPSLQKIRAVFAVGVLTGDGERNRGWLSVVFTSAVIIAIWLALLIWKDINKVSEAFSVDTHRSSYVVVADTTSWLFMIITKRYLLFTNSLTNEETRMVLPAGECVSILSVANNKSQGAENHSLQVSPRWITTPSIL
jgi:hypothetical protein